MGHAMDGMGLSSYSDTQVGKASISELDSAYLQVDEAIKRLTNHLDNLRASLEPALRVDEEVKMASINETSEEPTPYDPSSVLTKRTRGIEQDINKLSSMVSRLVDRLEI